MSYNNRTRLNDWDENEGKGGFPRHNKNNGKGRVFPCPQCGEHNRLTAKEKRGGYICDECADIVEGAY